MRLLELYLQVYCQDCGLKMCNEISQQLHSDPALHLQDHRLSPCCYKEWASQQAPSNAAEGIVQGIGGLMHELAGGVTDVLYDPVRGVYQQGISGAAAGLSTGLNSLISRPLAGGNLLLNKVKAGIQASLAANMHYGVTVSSFDLFADSADANAECDDPIGEGGVDNQGKEQNDHKISVQVEDRPPDHQHHHNNLQHRSLKMSMPSLPAIGVVTASPAAASVPPALTVEHQKQQEQEEEAQLGESSHLFCSALSSHSSPHTGSGSGSGCSSGAFYKRGGAGAYDEDDANSSGDESVYYEEETAPFLLYNSELNANSTKHISVHLSNATAPHEHINTETIPVAATTAEQSTLNVKVGSSTTQCRSTSADKVAPMSKMATADLVAADRDVLVDSEVDSTATWHAWQAALLVRKLFTDMGARNGRYMSSASFRKVMLRAIRRQNAVTPAEPTSSATDAQVTTSSGYAHDKHTEDGRGAGDTPTISSAPAVGINERSVLALVQVNERNH